MDGLNVNDGNGLLDNAGLIDSLIIDCNDLPKLLFEGRNVAFCGKIVEMVQKLSSLKKGIRTDQKALQDQIDEMTKLNNEMATELFELKTSNGNDTDSMTRE